MLKNEEPPVCDCGGVLTVKHILTDCVNLVTIRDRCEMKGDLKEDLGTDTTATGRTLKFLKEANLFHKI